MCLLKKSGNARYVCKEGKKTLSKRNIPPQGPKTIKSTKQNGDLKRRSEHQKRGGTARIWRCDPKHTPWERWVNPSRQRGKRGSLKKGSGNRRLSGAYCI